MEDSVAVLPPLPGQGARELGRSLGLSATLADVLHRRGYKDPELTRRFLNPKLADLTRPDAMADRELCADRLAYALHKREKICIFGDYDCDGMTAAAILTEILQALGGEVSTLLASRFDGGYGLSARAVERVLATGARLLVTCDCGSSDHVSIAALNRQGVETIVIDHHLVPAEKLPAFAFLNPHRPDCGFAYKYLASCGLVLSVGGAVRTRLRRDLDLKQWLDLVAIGTIADVAPLDGDNRALVRAGLRALAQGKRPGVQALLELSKISALEQLTARDVAFRLAPRLNAPGRLGAPDLALELLLSKNIETARSLARAIEQCSSERRAIQDRIFDEALQEIEQEGYPERPSIVVGREGWNHGIVGIVAGRLAAHFQRPVVVVGFVNGHGRGSVRGPAGARLFDAVAETQACLIRFGGHQSAAGVELELGRLAEFRARLEQAFETINRAAAASATPELAAPQVRFSPGDDPFKVVCDLDLLEPCGAHNPAPEVVLEAHVRSARSVTGGHLKLDLEIPESGPISGFGVGLGERASALSGRLVISGRLQRDTYRGGNAVELHVERIW